MTNDGPRSRAEERGAPDWPKNIPSDGAGEHGQQAVAPDNLTAHATKITTGDAVGQCGGDHLESVDLVQVLIAEQREHRDEQKACAGSEVANIKTDRHGSQKDRQTARRAGAAGRLVASATGQPSRDRTGKRQRSRKRSAAARAPDAERSSAACSAAPGRQPCRRLAQPRPWARQAAGSCGCRRDTPLPR
jgi:hypothetical protein